MFATIESRMLAYVESGAMASHALGLLLAGKRPAASRAADDRRTAARVNGQTAFINRERDTRLEHQKRADSATRAVGTD